MRTLTVFFIAGFAAAGNASAQSFISCTAQISSAILAFGNIVPASPTATSALLGDFVVNCANAHPAAQDRTVTLRLTISAGSSGSEAQREMIRAGAGSPLLYNLYKDAAYTTVWPVTTSDSESLIVPGQGSAELRRPIFGRVPGSQASVTPGLYSDTLTATVTY
jgi:spore coat protein U-like protein